ncbi:MAG: isopentenyl transferase family protein, partial [Variovorax sp.]|nr:isopentenyl transferase family protein [Variovorax sp.]
MPAERPRCLAIAGPTASGKSAASMVIAQRWPVEIISVDSALVYRGMDIGTAKPSPADGYTAICQCKLCEGRDSPERDERGHLS